QFRAMLTVRNSTDQPMHIQLQPQATGVELAAQKLELPAQSARELTWDVTVPASLAQAAQGEWQWQLEAHDSKTGAKDSLAFTQRVLPAVPLAVQQASLLQMDG